jgi:hypothetical protein
MEQSVEEERRQLAEQQAEAEALVAAETERQAAELDAEAGGSADAPPEITSEATDEPLPDENANAEAGDGATATEQPV